MFHPTRGGVRGGKDQFKWEDVKDDKFRENFLGHSVKAPVGRWQKGKDLTWYAKAKGGKGGAADPAAEGEQRRLELQRVKAEEEAAMMEMLGLAKPRRKGAPTGALEKREAEELFRRGKGTEALPEEYKEGERIQGLGFGKRSSKLASALSGEGSQPDTGRKDKDTEAQTGTAQEPQAGGHDEMHSKKKQARDDGSRKRKKDTGSSKGTASSTTSSSTGSQSGSGKSSGSERDSEGSDGEGGSMDKSEDKKESKSERKARKRREQRRERRRQRREEELSGAKGVSEKRLKRRRRELRLQRKKERREARKDAAENASRQREQEVGRVSAARGAAEEGGKRAGASFEDMFKAGHFMADKEGFVKQRAGEWRNQRKDERKSARDEERGKVWRKEGHQS